MTPLLFSSQIFTMFFSLVPCSGAPLFWMECHHCGRAWSKSQFLKYFQQILFLISKSSSLPAKLPPNPT